MTKSHLLDTSLRENFFFSVVDIFDVDGEVLTTESFTDEEILVDFSERQVEQESCDNDKDGNDVIDEPV